MMGGFVVITIVIINWSMFVVGRRSCRLAKHNKVQYSEPDVCSGDRIDSTMGAGATQNRYPRLPALLP